MPRIEDTGGNITYTIDNCDCGLTGGCWKCQPIHISRYGCRDYIFPESQEMLPRVKETYPEFGARLKAEIEKHPEWGAKLL